MLDRATFAATALFCLASGVWLAAHHPLAPTLVTAAFVLWSGIVFLRPIAWLFVVPALLPIIDLAPWTGWLIVEEFDILVLGAAAGAYASMALRRGTMPAIAMVSVSAAGTRAESGTLAAPAVEGARLSSVSLALLGLVAAWTMVGIYRGFDAAGSHDFAWFDAYYDASNSLRVAKSYLLATLMLPLLVAEMRRSSPRAIGALAAGLVAGLGLVSLAVLWERLSFPGLLNFSSDYRATALFWEMHVGGAALDGFLALTVPFAVREVISAESRARKTLAVLCLLLAAYACLTTFSRGVYLAVPASLGLFAFLLLTRGNVRSLPSAALTMLKGCVLIGVMAFLSHLAFRSGGYRSLLAVLGVFALTLPFAVVARQIPARAWAAGIALGVLAGMAGSAVGMFLFKGIYVNFALAFACCSLLLFLAQRTNQIPRLIVCLGAYVWLIMAAAGIALGWGGVSAFRDSAIVLSVLIALTLWNVRSQILQWPTQLQLQGVAVGLAALVAIATAVFSGGAYMTERISSSEQDLAGRIAHWRDGMAMLVKPANWLLGKGAGRFPPDYLFQLVDREYPGSSRIGAQSGESYLVLSGPRHEAGFGEVFRVAQQVSVVPGAPYSVLLDVRSEKAARLHVELCERHLIYVEECTISAATIPPTGESWQRRMLSLDDANFNGRPWYAPRPVFFAMAIESPGTSVVIDNVSLIGPDGRELLVNGDFAEGMARWFTTSDRFHLPWHIKNLGLNLLFDQGMIGLLLFVLLCCGALYRLIAGAARGHLFAPTLAAALVGFLLVGLFDSLLDVPRLAFLFYLLLMASLALAKVRPTFVNVTNLPEGSRRHRSSGQF